MKTKTVGILIVCLSLLAGNGMANPVTEEKALKVARKVLTAGGASLGRGHQAGEDTPFTLKCVRKGTLLEGGSTTYFIFNRMDSPGFAIVAGDDDRPVILGYSQENSIDTDNLPEALGFGLSAYDQNVVQQQSSKFSHARQEIELMEPGTPVVGPYIKTKWNQWEPYNWLTPISNYDGQATPTGCVPTGVAQILNYYKSPNIYHQYNWDAMRNVYVDYSQAEGMAVATLMRDLGALMGTSYGAKGSSTPVNIALIPGVDYKQYSKDDLTTDLVDKGPLTISGWSLNNTAAEHLYIIDGYDSNGLYHVNWGWGGTSDGYFERSVIAIRHMYLQKPDDEHPAAIPAAYGGVTIDTKASRTGHRVVMTLHKVKLVGGEDFDGFLSWNIYKLSERQFNQYAGNGFYGKEVQFREASSLPNTKWDKTMQGQDIDIELELGTLAENGYYALVPKYYNNREGSYMWRPFLQLSDGNFAEDIPFIYQDGSFIFTETRLGDVNVSISKIVTASTYREGGRSSMYVELSNGGNCNFTGKLTVQLENIDNTDNKRTVDFDLFVSARDTSRTTLSTYFDFTGHYRICHAEIWKSISSGERKTYYSESIATNEFTILPSDNEQTTTAFKSSMNVEVLWNGSNYYVNDSIYQYEEANVQFWACCLEADTATLHTELWAVPLQDGLPLLLGEGCFPLNRKPSQTYKIGGGTGKLLIGDYRLVAFGRCGNCTSLFSQPDAIGKGYSGLTDIITENIIHVFDSGIDTPSLKLHYLAPIGPLYYDVYNFAEAEIENTGTTDYLGYTSDCLVANSYLSITCAPFRLKAGQKSVVFPKIYLYKDYGGTNGTYDCYLRAKVSNETRELQIPVQGTFDVNFIEKPDKYVSPSEIGFYYKDNLAKRPTYGFYSKGTLMRSLWKGEQQIGYFSTIKTDSTYSTYHVFPEGKELANIPVGEYLLKLHLTDAAGFEWPEMAYPLIVDESAYPFTVEKVEFDQETSYSYDDDIPVIVTIKNPTGKTIETAIKTELLKQHEDSWWYYDETAYHKVLLPAMQSTTIKLLTHLKHAVHKSAGKLKVNVFVCQTQRESGHLDFGVQLQSEATSLPYVSLGILSIEPVNARTPVAFYSVEGKRIKSPRHGLFLVKYSDGSTEKIYLK